LAFASIKFGEWRTFDTKTIIPWRANALHLNHFHGRITRNAFIVYQIRVLYAFTFLSFYVESRIWKAFDADTI
jgi:hypothetical protein